MLVGHRQGENRKTLRQVCLHPGGEFGCPRRILGDELLEPLFGGSPVGTVKEAADGLPDLLPMLPARDIGLGILLKVELAALPRDRREDGGAGGFEADRVAARDDSSH